MREMKSSGKLLSLAVASVLTLLALANVSQAHGGGGGGSGSGLPIPALSHGEMAVLAPYHRAVLDLARSAADTNEPFRRMLNFAEIQYAYCLWGTMPGGVTDEESPFNECSHAYLAATKSVLLKMRDMPREAALAGTLVSRIDTEMALNSMSLIRCQYSGETFNTADIIKPRWTSIPFHAPSALALSGVLLAVSAAGLGGARLLRKRP
jgi:hypothetical protein